MYGNQQAIGEAFKTLFDNGEVKREDLFITSKLWLTHCTPEDYDEMLTQTLSDLGLSYLDLYLVSSSPLVISGLFAKPLISFSTLSGALSQFSHQGRWVSS